MQHCVVSSRPTNRRKRIGLLLTLLFCSNDNSHNTCRVEEKERLQYDIFVVSTSRFFCKCKIILILYRTPKGSSKGLILHARNKKITSEDVDIRFMPRSLVTLSLSLTQMHLNHCLSSVSVPKYCC